MLNEPGHFRLILSFVFTSILLTACWEVNSWLGFVVTELVLLQIVILAYAYIRVRNGEIKV